MPPVPDILFLCYIDLGGLRFSVAVSCLCLSILILIYWISVGGAQKLSFKKVDKVLLVIVKYSQGENLIYSLTLTLAWAP